MLGGRDLARPEGSYSRALTVAGESPQGKHRQHRPSQGPGPEGTDHEEVKERAEDAGWRQGVKNKERTTGEHTPRGTASGCAQA